MGEPSKISEPRKEELIHKNDDNRQEMEGTGPSKISNPNKEGMFQENDEDLLQEKDYQRQEMKNEPSKISELRKEELVHKNDDNQQNEQKETSRAIATIEQHPHIDIHTDADMNDKIAWLFSFFWMFFGHSILILLVVRGFDGQSGGLVADLPGSYISAYLVDILLQFALFFRNWATYASVKKGYFKKL